MISLRTALMYSIDKGLGDVRRECSMETKRSIYFIIAAARLDVGSFLWLSLPANSHPANNQ